MHDGTPEEVDAETQEWAEGAHRNVGHLADMLGITRDRFEADPLELLPGLQNYVSRLPLDQFEQSDWITLHSDLTSFLGDVLVRRRGAAWTRVDDPSSPAGYRYCIQASGLDGETHRVEPYDVVMEEFRNPPIEIARMIANAEAVLRVSPSHDE
ncbi:hypothetical protein [Streptomyces sp. AN091965]|uniref:hypothetical protein n=1 Tax=Streptomyces sp. AN091965 TaxID=2927803 RepID=UPI001F60726E|nr:hypothetical protein [Streptomyces sp. AN091965]MCI3930346.1 hypothetical protein [Streptomyces sp. AN091965]